MRSNTVQSVAALAGLMFTSPDESIAVRAWRALEELSLDDEHLGAVWWVIDSPKGRAKWSPGDALTLAGVAFLVTPVSHPDRCAHVPEVRVVRYLDSTEHRDRPRVQPSWSYETEGLPELLVESVSGGRPTAAAQTVRDLLSGTDHPELLGALERRLAVLAYIAMESGRPRRVRSGVDAATAMRQLWTEDGDPTPFTRIFLDNPSLPLGGDCGRWKDLQHYRVFAAIVTERLDRIADQRDSDEDRYGVVDALLEGASSRAPRRITDRCRTALRTLPPGAHRERLCDYALNKRRSPHQQLAREIVLDAGFTWQHHPAAFLYLTEQWERYDALDPAAAELELHAYCRQSYHAREEVAAVARRHNRPLPPPFSPPVYPRRARGGRTGGPSGAAYDGFSGVDSGFGGDGGGDGGGGGCGGGGCGGGGGM